MEVPLASVGMTDEATTNPPAAATQRRGDAKQDPRYERDQLGEYLGVPPHVVTAALADSPNETFTIKQAQKAVDELYGHEDESEMAQPDPEPDEAEE